MCVRYGYGISIILFFNAFVQSKSRYVTYICKLYLKVASPV